MITDKQKRYQKNKYTVSFKGKSKSYNYQWKAKSMIVTFGICFLSFKEKKF